MEKLIVDYKFDLQSNMDQVKDDIVERMKKYDVIVTHSTVAESKKLMADINKEKKMLNDTCKTFIDQVSEPITVFKRNQKEISSLYDDARTKLKNQVENFEQEILDNAKNLLLDYRNNLCEIKNIDQNTIIITDLILLGAVTSTNKLAKKSSDIIDARVQGVENEILKAKIQAAEQAAEEAKKIKAIQEAAKKEAEEEANQRAKEEAINTAIRIKAIEDKAQEDAKNTQDELIATHKAELLALDQAAALKATEVVVEVKNEKIAKKDPKIITALLTFEFETKGTPSKQEIIGRITQQITPDFLKYLVETEVL